MVVFINNQGELACSGLDTGATVNDLIHAVLQFCERHINCTGCPQTCCAGLTVYPDHVFLHRLLELSRHSLDRQDLDDLPGRLMGYDPAAGKWFLRQHSGGRCPFLSPAGRCMIYAARPLVCRLHVCGSIEPGFRELKFTLYAAYQDALCREMAHRLPPELRPSATAGHPDNPVAGKTDYDTPVFAISAWHRGLTADG